MVLLADSFHMLLTWFQWSIFLSFSTVVDFFIESFSFGNKRISESKSLLFIIFPYLQDASVLFKLISNDIFINCLFENISTLIFLIAIASQMRRTRHALVLRLISQ